MIDEALIKAVEDHIRNLSTDRLWFYKFSDDGLDINSDRPVSRLSWIGFPIINQDDDKVEIDFSAGSQFDICYDPREVGSEFVGAIDSLFNKYQVKPMFNFGFKKVSA